MLVKDKQVKIGLALSGGGFRAAVFHLGVLKQLLDWGILWEVDLISSLSGGSITGAFIALHWGDDQALAELESYLSSESLTNNYYLSVISPFTTPTEAMADSLRNNLFGDATLSDLAHGPRSYISTSNLATGNFFSFIAGGNEAPTMGEDELGYQQENAAGFKIADAIAASCAFAPVFPPYKLTEEHYKSELPFLTLTDGGLYDNLALDPLLVPNNKIDYAIVCDAGKPLTLDITPSKGRISAVWRTVDVLTEKVRVLQLERISLLHKSQLGPVPICFSIDSNEGCQDITDSEFCCAVPSELTALDAETTLILQRHAQNLLRDRISVLAPELLYQHENDVKVR